jgi:hypothetical protein
MASGLFSGDSRYRLDLSTGVSGTTINASISVTKTAGGGYWTGDAQWWRIRISGADQDGYWTYDFTGGTPKTIGIATRGRNVGYGTFLVESWVNMDSGLGQAYAAEWVTITNPATVPSAPATPTVSGIGVTSMTLSWSIPPNNGAAIDQMLLRRYSTADGTGPYVDYPNAGDATSRTVTGLTPGTQYSWAVYAHNSVGYSTRSGVRAAQTLAAARVPKAGVYVPASQVQAPKAGAFVAAQVKAPKNGVYVSTI